MVDWHKVVVDMNSDSSPDREWLIDIKDLHVTFSQDDETVNAVNGVDIRVHKGEAVGIVGESGCGKTVTSYSLLNILPSNGRIVSGEVRYREGNGGIIDITKLNPRSREMRKLRGGEIAMIFQEPMASFSPVHTIKDQIAEGILLHQPPKDKKVREKIIEYLGMVGISNPERAIDAYPFQLSGGMRQRAMIAMALACNPKVLVADEPTTALDVTIQAQVLMLIKEMQQELGLALVLITHDLGIIAHMADFVYVMYLGRVVEKGPVATIFDSPKHPYTRDLIRSIPKLDRPEKRLATIQGNVPDASRLPPGCAFHPRCREIIGEICSQTQPVLEEVEADHFAACFLHSPKREIEPGTGESEIVQQPQ